MKGIRILHLDDLVFEEIQVQAKFALWIESKEEVKFFVGLQKIYSMEFHHFLDAACNP